MSSLPIEVHVGDVFAGMEVLAISEAHPRSRRVYRVLNLCCGTEGVMSHSRLMRRRKKRQRLCRSCAQKEVMKQAALSEGVLRDGFGSLWPPLGPLGPRWRAGEPNSSRRAR